MNNHNRFTTVFGVALTAVLLLLSSQAFSNEARDTKTQKTPEVQKNRDVPEYFVPPPPFSEGIFPCSDCHADMEVNPKRRKLTEEHTEISEMFNHASEQRWCLDCHNPDDRDKLRLANGDLVSFKESYYLCGQCHGTIFRDWKAGIHGKRTGEWNGKKEYRLCVHCHNPHNPRFKPLKPMPPPNRPQEIKYQKLPDKDLPRNPLGDIK
ncbi:MAG: hypothetical protein ACWGOD_07130 [Desulfobulbales bacterium]